MLLCIRLNLIKQAANRKIKDDNLLLSVTDDDRRHQISSKDISLHGGRRGVEFDTKIHLQICSE